MVLMWNTIAIMILGAASGIFCQALPDPASYHPLNDDEAKRLETAWLHSGDSRQIAWAAELIARDERRDLIPDLVQQLSNSAEDRWSLQAIADALIQLQAQVPAQQVVNLPADFIAQRIILLARSQNNREALLGIFRTSEIPLVWLAAANLLADKTPSDIAKPLLTALHVEADMRVLTPGKWDTTSRPIIGRAWEGLGGLPKPMWPRVNNYALSLTKGAIIASGVHSVRYYPYPSTDPDWTGTTDPTISTDDFVPGLLAQLAQIPASELHLQAKMEEDIVFRGTAEYSAKITELLSSLDEDFARILKSYIQHGFLTTAEAKTIKAPVDFTVVDYRTSANPPLPMPRKFTFLALTTRLRR